MGVWVDVSCSPSSARQFWFEIDKLIPYFLHYLKALIFFQNNRVPYNPERHLYGSILIVLTDVGAILKFLSNCQSVLLHVFKQVVKTLKRLTFSSFRLCLLTCC